MRFRLILQEGSAIGKTRNPFIDIPKTCRDRVSFFVISCMAGCTSEVRSTPNKNTRQEYHGLPSPPLNLAALIQTVGYLGIFLIVFADSGVLLGLVLPGDSLLFTAGLLASQGHLNLWALMIVASLGAILSLSALGYWLRSTIPDIEYYLLPILGVIGLLALSPTIVHLIHSGVKQRHKRE